VNIVLFEPGELALPLPRSDRRAVHILTVLRRQVGDSFDAGVIDGPRGKATVVAVDESALTLAFEWGEAPPPLDPIGLVVGLPRPQTARKLLQEATALGVAAIDFVATERGERGYGGSRLWSTGEWRRHLIAGAEQAFTTRLPRVSHDQTLAEALAGLTADSCRLALDNYEAATPLSRASVAKPLVLAIGPERGWSAAERDLLREQAFSLVHLGERVLRTETACVAALALAKGRLGLI
jgi:RsmE family RNA methyltransferase